MQDTYPHTYEDDFDDEPATKTLSKKLKSTNKESNPDLISSLKSVSASNIDTSSNIKIPVSSSETLSKSPSSDKLSILIDESSSLKYKIAQIKEKLKRLKTQKLKSTQRGFKSPNKSLINEYLVIKNIYDKVFDYEFMIRLRDKIKQKEAKVQVLTNQITQAKAKVAEKDKGIIIAMSHSTNDLNRKEANHIMAMLVDMTEGIRQIKSDMDKDQENNKKNTAKEQILSTRLAKLEEIYEVYNTDDSENIKKQRQIEYSMGIQKLNILNKKVEIGNLSAKNRIKALNNDIDKIQKESEEYQGKISVKNEELLYIKKTINELSEALKGQKALKNSSLNAEITNKSIYFTEPNSSILENLLNGKNTTSKHLSSVSNTEKIHTKDKNAHLMPMESPVPFHYSSSISPQTSKSSLKKILISTNHKLQSMLLEKTNRNTSISKFKYLKNHAENPYSSILSELETKIADKNKKFN
ncbi:hypothetical protein SteCoe_37578 [Stentor coeruleus]|uniref:Uncharacterized protein n=1 Tax=Stentor coeruleus TaxID=5963 RepID=A0A1R2AMV2_9CILI|nr:hypothetical protein SteCoe_37578 [Stentor coeruleus]